MSQRHRIVVIIGPSGSGKSSVVRELHARGVVEVRPTWTTRSPRPDEWSGSPEHRFVSEADFDQLAAHGFFLASTTMFGLPARYGLPAQGCASGIEVIMLRASLVEQFRRFEPAFLVYQIEDDAHRVEERLSQRGTGDAELHARLADNGRELVAGRRVADRVFVNDRSIAALCDDITAALAADPQEVAA
ncbi:MAG: guanylate kinase [Actinomycetota bacterium]|jgi:guanylate kinase